MTKHFILYMLTLSLISCGQSQISTEKLVGNLQSDISLLLKEGKHTAYIMDGVKQSPKQAEITARLQKAMQEITRGLLIPENCSRRATSFPHLPASAKK